MSEDAPLIDEAQVKALAVEAKATYELRDRLQNRGMRTDKIRIFTDEVTANDHAEVELEIAKLKGTSQGLKLLIEAAGNLGLLDETAYLIGRAEQLTDDANADKIAKLEAEAAELKESLVASAFDFELRAVPRLIVKDIRRKTRTALGITTKGIPADQEEAFNELSGNKLVAALTLSYTDRFDGTVITNVTEEDAATFSDMLPEGEFGRLTVAVNELQFKNVITESITDSGDF